MGLELHANSSVLPFLLTDAGAGLVVFTGSSNRPFQQAVLGDQSPLKRGGVVISAGFSTSKTRQMVQNGINSNVDSSSRGTTVNLAIGYLISNRTQVGVSGSYNAGNNVKLMRAGAYVQTNKTLPHQFSIQPCVKRYLSESVLTPYVKGQFYWEFIKAGGPTTNSYGGQLSAGLAYLLGRRFIIEAELLGVSSSYSKGKTMENNIDIAYLPNRWNLQFDATLRPNFVLSYVLR